VIVPKHIFLLWDSAVLDYDYKERERESLTRVGMVFKDKQLL